MIEKKVSAIIPFFSRVDWLEQAVESVFEQTYKNIEIIVVNDGSPEDVSTFLGKYGDKIIYRYKENGGAATARNLAMELASGDYFAFLDSDDIWLPTKTEKQVAFMEKIGAVWSHTGFYYWTPESNKLKRIYNSDNYGDVYKKFFISTKIATPSVIVKANLFEEYPDIKFPEEYLKGQDVRFFRAISTHYKLGLLDEPLVKVRIRKNNAFKNNIGRFKSRASLFRKTKSDPKIPLIVKIIFFIYYINNKIFGENYSEFKNFIAKFFLVFPYSIERLYTVKINHEIRKDEQNRKFKSRH